MSLVWRLILMQLNHTEHQISADWSAKLYWGSLGDYSDIEDAPSKQNNLEFVAGLVYSHMMLIPVKQKVESGWRKCIMDSKLRGMLHGNNTLDRYVFACNVMPVMLCHLVLALRAEGHAAVFFFVFSIFPSPLRPLSAVNFLKEKTRVRNPHFRPLRNTPFSSLGGDSSSANRVDWDSRSYPKNRFDSAGIESEKRKVVVVVVRDFESGNRKDEARVGRYYCGGEYGTEER
ncbi:hypothetical protein AKJ16_DCAP08942, partial [Drosera capensis]